MDVSTGSGSLGVDLNRDGGTVCPLSSVTCCLEVSEKPDGNGQEQVEIARTQGGTSETTTDPPPQVVVDVRGGVQTPPPR